MMNIAFMNSKQMKRIYSLLDSQFGFSEKIDYVFVRTNKGKLYIVNRDVERIDLDKIRINSMGMYFGEMTNSEELRLSIDASQMLGPKCTKNILELDSEQIKLWMGGQDFELENDSNSFVLVKYKNDFVGCGKIKNKKLLNYVGKVRRIRMS